MSDKTRDLVIDAALAILALPILLVRAILRLRRLLARIEAVRRGYVTCACGSAVPTVRMATCDVCGWTTPGSLLFCRCGALFDVVQCPSCGATNAI